MDVTYKHNIKKETRCKVHEMFNIIHLKSEKSKSNLLEVRVVVILGDISRKGTRGFLEFW